jgi:hypothetical protein
MDAKAECMLKDEAIGGEVTSDYLALRGRNI